jgi:aminomethyltransferase
MPKRKESANYSLSLPQDIYILEMSTETAVKRTPFYNKHIELGARMLPFAGYEMPITYAGVIAEHEGVRNAAGLFDVSHMGEFILRGPNAIDLIQLTTSNDASKLFDGKVQYSCFPNEEGGIVDDLLVYRIKEDQYMLVVNASNIEKDWNWLKKNDKWNVEMLDISDKTALLALQGPKASAILSKLTQEDVGSMEYYTFKKGSVAGVENVLISATGYTGSGGFELYFDESNASQIWDAIIEAGKEFDIQPTGLACRDTLRLEMGFCLYGNDINDTTSPLEAGLGWITKFTKPFINSENLAQQKAEGLSKKLVAFELIDKGVPRQGYAICDEEGKVIGEVTSGTMSPSTKKAIGMGYVPTRLSAVGSEIKIQVRDKQLSAVVVKLPFYKA